MIEREREIGDFHNWLAAGSKHAICNINEVL